MGTTATVKITGILLGCAAKATWASRAALFGVFHSSIKQASRMLTLRGSSGNRLQVLSLKWGLLLPLKLHGLCGELLPKRYGL